MIRIICCFLLLGMNTLVSASVATPDSATSNSLVDLPRPPHSGIYALWYGDQDSPLLDEPYVVGGQVVCQWADLEPEEGKYDFSALEDKLKALNEKGKATTVQVNGNVKPAWLFNRVPYTKAKLHGQVNNKQGTLMYWHPNHVSAYFNFVRALAKEVKHSPYRAALLGVRMNYNAIGTELTRVPEDQVDLKNWILPEGVKQGEQWTAQIAEQYQDQVVQTFVENFLPDVRVFVRSTVNDATRKRFDSLFQTGKLGWFHTSSRPEQPNSHDPKASAVDTYYRAQLFIDYCRSGKTLGYTEISNETWSTKIYKSPAQVNYWRCLDQIHCGVSFIGIYSRELGVAFNGMALNKDAHEYQQEFKDAFLFAAKYAGYHASPSTSPGAWIAFRDSKFQKGDYSLLMSRLPDKSTVVENVGPTSSRFGMWARVLQPGDTMQLQLNPLFLKSLGSNDATIHLIYLDEGNAKLQAIAGDKTFNFDCTNSGQWKDQSFKINPSSIQPGASAHITLQCTGNPITLHMLEVLHNPKSVSSKE